MGCALQEVLLKEGEKSKERVTKNYVELVKI